MCTSKSDVSSGPAAQEVTFTDGLRRLADLLDEHDATVSWDEYRHLINVNTRDEMMAVVRKIGGLWTKSPGTDYFGMDRDLGGGVRIHVYAPRGAVCERVVVGTEKVLVPDPDAPKVEREREIVEWRCDPILASMAEDES